MEYVAAGGTQGAAGDMQWLDPPRAMHSANLSERASPRSAAMPTSRSELRTPPALEASGAVEHAMPPIDMHDINEEADGAPLRYRTMADLLGVVPP
jgi:hypothetical protein